MVTKGRALRIVAVPLLLLLMVTVSAQAAGAGSATKYGSVNGCTYKSLAYSGFDNGTVTSDVNGGCVYLTAGLRYSCDGYQTIHTTYASTWSHWINSVNAWAGCGHHQSLSQAADNEYGRWGSTGWWG
jgi:hypothetical protein